MRLLWSAVSFRAHRHPDSFAAKIVVGQRVANCGGTSASQVPGGFVIRATPVGCLASGSGRYGQPADEKGSECLEKVGKAAAERPCWLAGTVPGLPELTYGAPAIQ